jgi:hypothetical protein
VSSVRLSLWLACGFDRRVDVARGWKYKPDNVPTINELFQLTDRVAIVTGGSRGIGRRWRKGSPKPARR